MGAKDRGGLLILAQISLQQLRDHLSVFQPGFPLQKGYVAQLLFQHSLSDVVKKVKAIVTAAKPNKYLHEESLHTQLDLFKKFIFSKKNLLLTEWPTCTALLLEPFLITFRCPTLSPALKSIPSSENPEQTSTQIPLKLKHFSQTPDTLIRTDLPQTPDTEIHSDLPQTPDTQILPQTPDTQIYPDLPQTPDTQIYPDLPQTPDTEIHSDLPQTPDTQILPQTPDTQIYPDLPQTPDTQIYPELPQTPDTQILPQTPDTQIYPDLPQTPDTLIRPDLPQTPDTQIYLDLPQTPDTQIYLDLPQTLDTLIHSDLPQTPDTLIRPDLPQTPDTQIYLDLPQTLDTLIHTDLPQTPDTLIESDNLQTSTPAQTAAPTQSPPINLQPCSATCSSQSLITVKQCCASCATKQRANITMLQENEHIRHQLKDLKTLFRAEKKKEKDSKKKIRRKTKSVMIWRNKYTTLKASNDTQKLLDSVYSLEQKVKTLEENLIAAQEESLNMTSVIEQLKSMHEETENYDAHLKYVSSASPSHNAYTQTDIEENGTVVYNSQSSVCHRQGVLSDKVSHNIIINTKNMVENVSCTHVRSQEEKNTHTPTEAPESVIIMDFQVMMAGIKKNHNDKCSEDLQQGRSSKLLEQGLSDCQKTTQQNVANIISSINSLEEILASKKSCQPSVFHVSKHHTIGNKCDSSGGTFKENIFQKHRLTHAKFKLYKCDVCGHRFAKDSLLKIHKRAHTKDKPCKCYRGRGFSVKENKKMHTRTHTGEKPHKCDVCGLTFSGSGELDVHNQSHTGERPYQCDFCGLSFTEKCSLEIHTRTHNSLTQLKCNVCSLEFEEKADLRKHKKVHKGEKNCVCNVCGQRFKTKCHLTSHSRKHVREKPYHCDDCGRSFAHKNSFKRHIRVHTDERPYKCDVCGFAFRQSSCLSTHKLIHTGEKPYMCDICGFQVNRKDNLRLHKRVHQKNT